MVWPLLVAIVGGAIWGFSKPGKVMEVGKITFTIGLFWLVHLLSGRALHI